MFDSICLAPIVKLVAPVKLLLTAEQTQALAATLAACNRAATWVSTVTWDEQVFRNYDLRGRTYGQVKTEFGLSAQPAQHVIKKVADAYRNDRQKRRRFRPLAAQPYDDRCLSWQLAQQTVSIWTVRGRLKGVRFTCGDHQRRLLASRRGESDLVFRDGIWWLLATCEVPEPSQQRPVEMLGVDLGVVNIATTSDGTRYSGSQVNRVRHRNRLLRQRLQRNGSKSSKRLLRKPQRATLHSWSFGQLGGFINYKARLAGVRVVFVNPAFTSQQCSRCGHVDGGNRPNQCSFQCRRCGFAEHADVNAAVNLKVRGWAAVNPPNADTHIAPSDAA